MMYLPFDPSMYHSNQHLKNVKQKDSKKLYYIVNAFHTFTYRIHYKPIPVKFALNATAFSMYAPLKVEPLKSDSLISADVKLALLCQ